MAFSVPTRVHQGEGLQSKLVHVLCANSRYCGSIHISKDGGNESVPKRITVYGMGEAIGMLISGQRKTRVCTHKWHCSAQTSDASQT